MDIHLFFSAFLFLSSLQGFFLSLMIFKNIDRDRHEKYFLIIVIVFFSVNLLVNEVIRFAYGSASDLRLAPFAFQLLLGPAFYHYCKNSIVSGYRHKPVDIVMFLPFPVYVAFVICVKLSATLSPFLDIASRIVWFITIIELVVYVVIIRRMLADYEKNLDENLSDKRLYSLRWLNHLASAITALTALFFALHVLNLHILTDDIVMGVYSLFLVFFIYLFGYKGLTQKILMYDEEKTKYEKSPLSKDYTTYWKDKLLTVLENEKPYLDPDLTLLKLAGMVGTSDKILSQIINSELNITFYDLINNFRIEEVKKQLLSDKNITILESAYASGFNSKTAFNTLFKKKTSMTPTQFIKSNKK